MGRIQYPRNKLIPFLEQTQNSMKTLLPRTPTPVNPPPVRADRNPLKHHPYAVGLALVGLSTTLFVAPLIPGLELSRDSYFGLFGVHFLLTAGYALALRIGHTLEISKRLKRRAGQA